MNHKIILCLFISLFGCLNFSNAQVEEKKTVITNDEDDLYNNFNHDTSGKTIRLIRLKNNGIAFAKGLIGGMILAMLLGPVFFALIRTSLDKGFTSGAYLAMGVALSDGMVALVIFSGLSQFTDSQDFRMYLGLIGGGLMIIFGALPFIKPAEKAVYRPDGIVNGKNSYFRKFLQGILLNMLNPFVYFFWIGIIGSVSLESSNTNIQILFFLLGIITAVFCTDLLKVYIANRITNFLTAQLISRIDKVAGVGLFAFGLRLLYLAAYGK